MISLPLLCSGRSCGACLEQEELDPGAWEMSSLDETPLFLLERGSPCPCSAGLPGRQPCHGSTHWPCGPGVRIVSSLACQGSSAAVPSRAGAAGSASCPALGRPVSSARKRRCLSRKGLPHQQELKVGVVWRSQHRPCGALVTQPSRSPGPGREGAPEEAQSKPPPGALVPWVRPGVDRGGCAPSSRRLPRMSVLPAVGQRHAHGSSGVFHLVSRQGQLSFSQ